MSRLILALLRKVNTSSFSVWKLSEGLIVPWSVFVLSMLIVIFSEKSICADTWMGASSVASR